MKEICEILDMRNSLKPARVKIISSGKTNNGYIYSYTSPY